MTVHKLQPAPDAPFTEVQDTESFLTDQLAAMDETDAWDRIRREERRKADAMAIYIAARERMARHADLRQAPDPWWAMLTAKTCILVGVIALIVLAYKGGWL